MSSRNQREWLIAAIAEECAEVGYAEATVAAVAKQAGVSSLTVYKQFEGKRKCMLAAHEELGARLLEALDGRAAPTVCPDSRRKVAGRAES
jgi:AcrR family transcriptional regulator